jgi:hypothetical protein
MTLKEVKELLCAVALSRCDDPGTVIDRAYCADLMSDVLAFSSSNSLLVTGLTNTQVIRTAEIADVRAIVFIQSKRPDIETIALADEKGIPLLVTEFSMFDACGVLYDHGLRCCPDGRTAHGE